MIFLVAPLSWDHHLVYILPTVVLAIRYLASGKVGPKGSTIMVAALFLLAWNIPLDQPGWKDGWWTLLISVKFYSVMALWIFFVCRIRQSVLALGDGPDVIGVPAPDMA
jgi:peptidoglycan/LPS O-acetylase OafA/YrhL